MANIRRLQQAAHRRILANDDDVVNEDNIEEYADVAVNTINKWLKQNGLGKLKNKGFKVGWDDLWYAEAHFPVNTLFNLMGYGRIQINYDGVCYFYINFSVVPNGTPSKSAYDNIASHVMTIDLNKKKVTDVSIP